MPFRVWAGTVEADHHSEVLALQELAELLRDRAVEYYILWNFHLPGRQIDMVVMRDDRIFCIELKFGAGEPIVGSMNGQWTRADGVSLGTPVPQLLRASNRLRDWLKDKSQEIWSNNELVALDLKNFGIRSFVVVYPVLHADSQISVAGEWRLEPPHGGVIGFDEVLTYLVDPAFAGRLGAPLQDHHVEKIATLLGLSEIAEVRSLKPVRRSTDTVNLTPHRIPKSKPWLVGLTGAAALLVLILLIYPWKDAPVSPSQGAPVSPSQDARVPDRPVQPDGETLVPVQELRRSDIGKEIAILVRIDEVYRRAKAVFMFTSLVPRGSFSIEVRSNSSGVDAERLARFQGQWVVLGPVKITADGDGDPQVEFSSVDEALSLMRFR